MDSAIALSKRCNQSIDPLDIGQNSLLRKERASKRRGRIKRFGGREVEGRCSTLDDGGKMAREVRLLCNILVGVVLFIMAIFIWILISPVLLYGQVTDTITVTITGHVTEVVLTADYLPPLEVGDTLVLNAVVLDEDMDPVPAVISFFSEDTTAMRIVPIERTDYPVGVKEALGIALKKANNLRLWVMAEPVSEVRVGWFLDGEIDWGTRYARVGETAQACAYLVDPDGYLLGESPGPPTCPVVFTPRPLPVVLVRALGGAMPVVDRALSWRELEGLARGLR
jgi:hypothetical protein